VVAHSETSAARALVRVCVSVCVCVCVCVCMGGWGVNQCAFAGPLAWSAVADILRDAGGIVFDNVLITNSEEAARDFASKTWAVRSKVTPRDRRCSRDMLCCACAFMPVCT
jgi:hypothetical protein